MALNTSFPIEEHRLDNGLRVVLSEDHVAPVVAVNLWYDVGSRNERPTRTGLAHLFEHLMFEGSRQVQSGEHFHAVMTAGGSLNGTTSTERTNYFESVPAEQLDLMLWLEADRMGGLLDALTQQSLDKQRDVVRNERRQRYDNQPYGSAFERLCELLFPPGHPYHHQPIGSMEDLAAASLEDVQDFFRTHYAPNNAVLTIVGDIDPKAALARVEHYFGDIPANPGIPEPPDGTLATPLPAGIRTTMVERVPNRAVYLGYRLPAGNDPRLAHLEVAFAILSKGRGSLFHRNLVQRELAQQANTTVDRRAAGASLGVIIAMARDGVPIDKLETAVHAEIGRLAEEGPTEAELARAKAVLERQWLEQLADVEGRADELSRCATLFGDPTAVREWLTPHLATTADEVRAALSQLVVDNQPAVLEYEPGELVEGTV